MAMRMAFSTKLFWIYLAPLVAILSVPVSSLGISAAFEQAILPYIAHTPLAQYFLDPSIPPAEIPLLLSSTTQQSHVEKIGPIAVALADLGHPVTFMCGKTFQDYISNLHPNVRFYPFQGLDDKLTPEDYEYWMSLPTGVEKEIWVTNKVVVDGAPDAHNTYQAYFKEFRQKYGDQKPLISLFDSTVTGHQTVHLGVPGIKPDVSIGIHLLPLLLHSNETFPPRYGRTPHQRPDAKVVHQKAYETIKEDDPYEWEVSQAWWEKLKEMGSPRHEFPQILDGMNRNADQLLAIGIPEFEFPRAELDIDLRYFGALTKARKDKESAANLPSWWDDLLEAKVKGKKIVCVTQGTVETLPEELILPTMKVLGGNEELFIIATFYNSEPEEVRDLVVPANARVAKYIPHDELLPLVDVMVSNGGYGGVQKCLFYGVPMVIAGTSQDKATNAAIAEFTGFGINLRTQSPDMDDIKNAVEKILGEEKYRKTAKELSKSYDRYDMQREFETAVQDGVRSWQKGRKLIKEEL